MQTQHYGFKLFEAAEKPTWLTDWNNTMNKIDSTIARLTGGGDTPDLAELTQRVQALEGRVDSDELRLNVVEGDIVDMLQTLSDVQTALSQAQSDIVANKSYSDGQISDLNDDINNINTSLGSMSSSITSLSDRVTALENAPSGGVTMELVHYFPRGTTNGSVYSYDQFLADIEPYDLLLVVPLNTASHTTGVNALHYNILSAIVPCPPLYCVRADGYEGMNLYAPMTQSNQTPNLLNYQKYDASSINRWSALSTIQPDNLYQGVNVYGIKL